jgi:hypothetical protein
MRILIQIIGIVLLGYIAVTYLPWYSVAFVAMLMGYAFPSKTSFPGGFLGVVALWGIKIFKITSVAAAPLAEEVAVILPVKEVWMLVTVTLVIGGLIGGLAALTGSLLRPAKRKSYYR